ncbi:hypothetical protein [Ideonella sp.]|uniref:hypothetical protein n=1 Tax=Ideonella sp. TaxID=1929293 RepID=UPI0035AED7AC
MSGIAQSATVAYNTPRSPRVLQDAAAQWLGAAHYETELAQELVLAGFELAAKAHATFAAECLTNANRLFERGETWVGASTKFFNTYQAECGARHTHALKLLKRQA